MKKTFRLSAIQRGLIAAGVCLAMATSTAQADRVTSYTRTDTGQVESIDGPRTDAPDINSFTYDASGNRRTATNALGHVTQYTHYDATGRLLRMVDPNGLVTSFTYHPRGWLLSRTLGDGSAARTTIFEYDATGNLAKLILPTGGHLEYRYDTANRRTEVIDSDGNRITYTYNPLGEITTESFYDVSGNLRRTLSRVFNSLNLLQRSLDANGHAITHAHDANGNRTISTDALSRENRFVFDALNRLVKQIDPLLGETRYTYDARDNLVSVVAPNGNVTSYEYNAFDDRVKEISPDRGNITYSYDDAGNLLTQTDARGVTVSHSYDALNRRSATVFPLSDENIAYTYDEGDNGKGRLTGIEDASGNTRYRYDEYGQLIEDTHTMDGRSYTLTHAYDDNGQLESIGYPSGGQLHYQRDALGGIIQVDWETASGTTSIIAENIAYEPFGPMKRLDFGNGLQLQRHYDANYRLVSQSVGSLISDSYAYDLVGNVTRWTDVLSSSRNQSFSYDDLDRLHDANGPWGQWIFSHDLVGNRSLLEQGTLSVHYDYEVESNRLINIDPPAQSYRYDEAGNLLSDGQRAFTYNQAGRMASASDGTTSARYRYNARGERVSKSVDGLTTYFRYSIEGQLLGEYRPDGTPVREYAYLDGQPLALMDAATNSVAFYHNDHLGTPRILTDGNAAVVWEATRLPFGETWITKEDVVNPIRFPGQYFDEETGLHYNYFRDYDPSTGRYIQSDPIGLAGGLNTYVYVGSNPLNYMDLLGLHHGPKHGQMGHGAVGDGRGAATVGFGGAFQYGPGGAARSETFGLDRNGRFCFVTTICWRFGTPSAFAGCGPAFTLSDNNFREGTNKSEGYYAEGGDLLGGSISYSRSQDGNGAAGGFGGPAFGVPTVGKEWCETKTRCLN